MKARQICAVQLPDAPAVFLDEIVSAGGHVRYEVQFRSHRHPFDTLLEAISYFEDCVAKARKACGLVWFDVVA